jgi:hypothetical protein
MPTSIFRWSSPWLVEFVVFTAEIIFHIKHPSSKISFLAELAGVQRIESIKIMGVIFSSNLRVKTHVDSVITACAHSFCASYTKSARSSRKCITCSL